MQGAGRRQRGRFLFGQIEQAGQARGKVRLLPGQVADAPRAFRLRQVEQRIEQAVEQALVARGGRVHGICAGRPAGASSQSRSHARARIQSRCTVRSGISSASAVSVSDKPAK